MNNWRKIMTLLAISAVLLSGCSGSVQKTEGLDQLGRIQAVTREEDSGTRASFDSLIGITSEQGNSIAADSTEQVLKSVKGNTAAIGYMTVGSVTDQVKTLKVNNKDITDGKYPLTRKLYVVYKGELSEAEQEFLTYITGKGQSIVAQHFEPVGKEVTFLSLKPAGSFTVGGSSSEAPVMEELAKAYMAENPNVQITVETTDSGTGVNGALDGTYDLGMSSRELRDYEKNLLTYTAIAKDRIAIVVDPENPMKNITKEQLKAIYSGSVTDWTELNS